MSATLRRTLYGVVIVIALYTLLGFFLVPYVAKQQIQKNVEAKLGAKPEIEKITFNPFTFEMVISGFNLPGAAGESRSRLKFDTFLVRMNIFALVKKEILIKSINLKAADAQFIVFKNGGTNWEIKEEPLSEKEKSKDSFAGWTLTLEHIQIDRSSLDFLDNTHISPLDLPMGPVTLSASNISTILGERTAINSLVLAVGENGHIKIKGSMNPKPFATDISLDITEMPMDFLTAYLSDKTYLILEKGSLDVLGELKYDKGNISFVGTSDVHNLVLGQENADESVLTLEKMNATGIDVQTRPMKIRIQVVTLTQPATKMILRKDGTLNFKSLSRSASTTATESTNKKSALKPVSKPAPAEENTLASPPLDLVITKLVITKGILDYADQQIKPNFSAHVHNIEGTLSPLSLLPTEKINVALDGQVEAYGKFNAKGYFIPGVKYPALNLDMNFHNIEMTTFTPYSGKFAGYEITKGKLFLDLNYVIANHRIKGKNQVLLDQFTLGNKVPSENSTNWPVKLALALMKDRKGQIKFKLPVEGDLNSPSFSWSNLIWTALKNMVVNIVTAPFTFIASLFGGGDDLQNIVFEPGTAVVPGAEQKKLESIASALDDRPNLSLEIKGGYDEKDLEVLRQKNFEKVLKPVLKNNTDRSAAVLKMARNMLKPDDLKKFTEEFEATHGKNSPEFTPELEKKMASTIAVSETEWRDLCLARGNAVMAALVQKKINADRMYLLAGSKSDGDQPPRVLLTLKEK